MIGTEESLVIPGLVDGHHHVGVTPVLERLAADLNRPDRPDENGR